MFGPLSTTSVPAVSHWYYYRSLLLSTLIVSRLSYAVTNPVILINNGGGASEVAPTLMDCSQKTPEYDAETGITTYKCKPVVKDVVEKIYVTDTEYVNDANDTIIDDMIVKAEKEDENNDVKYEFLKLKSSKKKRKNRKNRKSKNTRKDKNYYLHERMISDAPMNDNSISKVSKHDMKSGFVHSVGKFDLKNRCAPGEVYASELHLCLPHKKKSKHPNRYDQPQDDAFTPSSKQYRKDKNRLLNVIKTDIQNHCSLGELYIPELDICLPHDYKTNNAYIQRQLQANALNIKSKHYKNKDKMPMKISKFEGKSRCGHEEVYISELDICLLHSPSESNSYDRPQADDSNFKPTHHKKHVKRPLKVGKFHGKRRCELDEVYVSELDICLPNNNPVDESNNIYNQPQADSLTLEPYEPNNNNKIPIKVSKFEGRSRCGSEEVYLSELDICLPHDNKLVQFSIHNRPQRDMPEDNTEEINESEDYEDGFLSFQSEPVYSKIECGPGEIYQSELDICIPHKS